jgi:HD superfamily phosphodiesterase
MTSKSPSGFHYFVHDGMRRDEKIQAGVVHELLNSELVQEERESSVQWELKHSSGVIQLARLLAQKRGVDEELAVVAAALHDIHVIVHGTYEDHALLGGRIARKILEATGDFSPAEITRVVRAVENHSDKHVYSEDELSELIKDADVLDVCLYGDRLYDYKPERLRVHYMRRMGAVRAELGLPGKGKLS